MAQKKRLSREARRVQLLDAAAKLFCKSSYGQVTTADLAEAAGVTEPVLYQHFETKLDLYVALVKRAREVTFAKYEELTRVMPTPMLKVLAIIRAHGGVMREFDPYFRLHLRALAASDMPRVRQALRENYLAYVDYFATLIRQAQLQGEIDKAVDPVGISWFIMSQGLLLNLCNQLGLTEIHEKGYIDNLLKDVLAQISLIEAPLEILGKLLPKEPAAPVADAEPLP